MARPALSHQDAHFLHGSRPLEALVRPPVEEPRALAWVPGQEIMVVASRSGLAHLVEPGFGTRELFRVSADPVRILLDGERLACVDRRGLVQVRDLMDGSLRWERETGLILAHSLVWWRGGLAIIGEDETARRVIVFTEDGSVRARARVPARTALGATGDGHLVLARSTATGITVTPFGRPLAEGDATEHHLKFGADMAVIGVAIGGVTVWSVPGAPPTNVKLFDVCNASLSPDGQRVAMGTRVGGVAIASANAGSAERVNPARVEGHESPVSAMEFSSKGRWLATAADRCIIWGF